MRYILGNLRTGRRILDLPVLTGPWNVRVNTPGTISCRVDMNDPDVQQLGMRNTSRPTQTFLGVAEGNWIIEAGPIWTRTYDRDSRVLELGAKGIGSIFNYRTILPLLAKTIPVNQWTVEVPDPEDPSTTITVPNPDLATTLAGVSLGTRAKRLIQQTLLWTGGNLPIDFQDDEAADRTKTYDAVEFKGVLEAIEDNANLENGPEFAFLPSFTEDQLGVRWLFRTGTEEQPLITSTSVPWWNVTAAQSPVSGLKTVEDGSKLVSLGWQLGGKQEDSVLVGRAYDPALVDAGYPLMENVDSSHATVSEQATLDEYAVAQVAAGQRAEEVWSFTAKAHPVDEEDGTPAGPQFGQYRVGDYAEVSLSEWHAATDDEPWELGDPFLSEGGSTEHRIVGLAGDEQGEDIDVSLAPRME